MRAGNDKYLKQLLAGAILVLAMLITVPVSADSLMSVSDEAQIAPIKDGSGMYLLKSDGFYCLMEDGSKHTEAAIHYFDHMHIDGTVLNGWYYHDENGCFRAGNAHLIKMDNLSTLCTADEEDEKTVLAFEGYYMVNNLGRLSAAPQVRYIDSYAADGETFDGYYYFDEYGQMVTEKGIHSLNMTSNGKQFSGYYYFGGENGVLCQETCMTEEGLPVDEDGRLGALDDLGMDTLEPQLEAMLESYDGNWSVYVKNLDTDEEIVLNDMQMYPASLIKAFVMAKTFADMDEVVGREAALLNIDEESARVKVNDLLWNMITVSDNESCNELGRLQSDSHDFLEGARQVNEYLQQEGYLYTSYQSTLHPSSSEKITLGDHNTSTVSDCGLLLERIYRGECVSEEASQKMLEFMLNQENTSKIPAGICADVKIANKTGETDSSQHDMAIVYGPKTTYILCIMSEDWTNGNTAIENIRSISKTVYNYLNLTEYTDDGKDSTR